MQKGPRMIARNRKLRGSGPVVAVAIVSLLANHGCATRLKRTLSADATLVDRQAPYLKAHLRDGSLLVFSNWKIDDEAKTVSGHARRYPPDRHVFAEAETTLPVGDVALFESNVVVTSPTVTALTVIAVASAIVTVECAINPKACFGSCPTFYTGDGPSAVLEAEGFSASIAPALEATDVDTLRATPSADGTLRVRMTNEAFETHVVRSVSLLAVPIASGRVFAAVDGSFWQSNEPEEPTSCRGPEGDCRAHVARADGDERFSTANAHDLATRETLELEFSIGERAGQRGIVITARQTLLSTFLLYQGLAYMGRSAGRWMAMLETGDVSLISKAQSFLRVLGGIEVLVEDSHGEWEVAGEIDETGPLARDTHLLPLPPGSSGARVRLRMTEGHWRIDQVGLVTLGARVEPLRLSPRFTDAQIDPTWGVDRRAATSFPVVTLPGDRYDFAFALPDPSRHYALFLETRGYYIEWMRNEWLADESPELAWQMVVDPRTMLEKLAPAFKRVEAQMENAFWRSRYVGR
jgi:hypothetical protein